MIDFKIRRGLSTVLFSEPGKVNPKLKIEEMCWYLCTDTAELFLGVKENDNLVLKQINAKSSTGNAELDQIIKDINELKGKKLYQQILSEDDLPKDFDSIDFDPNIAYYIALTDINGNKTGKVSTYIFDTESESYLCTSSVDKELIESVVVQTIDTTIDAKLDIKIPQAIKDIFSNKTILFGGTATN